MGCEDHAKSLNCLRRCNGLNYLPSNADQQLAELIEMCQVKSVDRDVPSNTC